MTMTLNPDDAAASLDEIASVEQRTRQTLVYGRSSVFFILWGVLLVIGYCLGFAFPTLARTAWFVIFAVGFAACGVLGYRRPSTPAARARWDRPLLFGQLVLYAYGWMFQLIVDMTPRQQGAFWPNLFMLGFALAGLWLGRFYLLLGLSVNALTVVGYRYTDEWFQLWMAAVGGGGMILGGLWLRRSRDPD
ncbi:MAG: hypothetical protein JO021_15030 [Alphaproteobacteria bacterium]|nr:hypothetical protein [Alphaproteobacteria bacterium]